MNEKKWLACRDPEAMWVYLYKKGPSDRKLGLFGCACCRRIWHLLSDRRSRKAIEVAERDADGQISEKKSSAAHKAAYEAQQETADENSPGRGDNPGLQRARWFAAYAAFQAIDGDTQAALSAIEAAALFAGPEGDAAYVAATKHETKVQVRLLRCIFKNPFQPLPQIDPAWLTWGGDRISHLARSIYETYDFTSLSVLGDALEEAGCTDQDILNHCRQPGEHALGCWILDLLLGKE